MDEIANISPVHLGWIIWVVWALIGIFEALMANRLAGMRRALAFDIIIGIAAAVLGGFLSTRFLGDTPMQLFLVSVLGAVFFGAAVLWFAGWLMNHFRKDEDL